MRLLRNGDKIILTRAQRGWLCEVLFSAFDETQATSTDHKYLAGSRFWWLALWRGWRGARQEKRCIEAAALPKRKANGWT